MIILALVISLSLMMFLINKKYQMGAAIMLGSLVLVVLAGLSPHMIFTIALKSLIDKNTVELVVSVYFVSLLGSMMQGYGIIDRMVEYLEKTFKSGKLLLFIIPTLLSTFSVAGSAIFAAPIIDVLGDKVGISQARKAAINLYIRHAWFFALPITVTMMFAASVAGVSVWDLISVQYPVAIVCVVTAYLVYIAPLKDRQVSSETEESRGKVLERTFYYTSPIILTLVLVLFLPFYLALAAGCVLTYFIKAKKGDFRKMLLTKQGINMMFAAASIMVFKDFIDNIPGIRLLIQDILSRGIPLEAILIILPLGFGYILANPSALIGMLFPILLPLVPPDKVLATAALINIVGYTTYYISPLHLCQALTNEFFCIPTRELYREYKITVPVMFVAAILNYLIMR